MINKRGTTWKKLDAETQNSIVTEESAFAILEQNTSMIKRPVIETDDNLLLGFDEEKYNAMLL